MLRVAAGASLACAACAADAPVREAEGATPGADPAYVLVWADEFDGDALDPAKWAPEVSCWGGGNDERQCYTGRAENVSVRDGALRLIARAERFEGPMLPPERRDGSGGTRVQDYTSGKVRTLGLADWRYGRFSARMRLPAGQGAWPAFWMMPSDPAYGGWPQSGEIDVMEAVNLGTDCMGGAGCEDGQRVATSAAIHFGELPPANRYLTVETSAHEGEAPHEGWHTYAAEWGEGVIQWFVDGELFMRTDADDWNAEAWGNGEAAPFDQPFYLMLNLAAGGQMPERQNGAGFDPGAFPATLEVDWVRVEQCEGDTTGRACMRDEAWPGALESGP